MAIENIIITNPRIHNGEPFIDGLSLKVSILKTLRNGQGLSKAAILNQYRELGLTMEELDTALAYEIPAPVIQEPEAPRPARAPRRKVVSTQILDPIPQPIPEPIQRVHSGHVANYNYFVHYRVSGMDHSRFVSTAALLDNNVTLLAIREILREFHPERLTPPTVIRFELVPNQ